jgi:V8-like Glu-specific endopeptidase
VEQLDERVLPSVSAVSPTAGSPLTAVVQLEVTYPDNQTVAGTGAMVDSSHVLTVAHLLYSAQDGGYATSIVAIPAASTGGAPFGTASGRYERVDPSWFRFNQAHPGKTSPSVEDVGVVTLDQPIGNSTGFFALGHQNNNAAFTGATFQTAGYPILPGVNSVQMYAGSGKALGVVSTDGIRFAQSSLPAIAGQSGSPVYQVTRQGSPVLYGVITGADGFTSRNHVYAARITNAVFNEVQSWLKVDRKLGGAYFAALGAVQHPGTPGSRQKGAASSTPTIYALDSWWSPWANVFANAQCVAYNFYNGNWGSQYYPQNWQQVWAPAPPNCIYPNPSNDSAYNGYYYDDYSNDSYYYV